MKQSYDIDFGKMIPELEGVKISGTVEMTATEAVVLINETKKFIAELPEIIRPIVTEVRSYLEETDDETMGVGIIDEEGKTTSFNSYKDACIYLNDKCTKAEEEAEELTKKLAASDRKVAELSHRLEKIQNNGYKTGRR